MKEDRLNSMLREWADRHTCGRADLADLAGRIRHRLAGTEPRLPDGHAEDLSSRWRSRTLWMLGGAAALLILQLTLNWMAVSPQETDSALQFLATGGDTTSTTVRFFGEAEAMFPGRLQWVVETDEDVHLELTDAPALAEPLSEFVELRLIALCRTRGQNWRRVWTAAVVCSGNEVIAVDIPGQGRAWLWAKRVDDDLIAVDTQLVLQTPEASTSLSRGLMPGVPERCMSIKTPTSEFRVYQIATPAKPKTEESAPQV